MPSGNSSPTTQRMQALGGLDREVKPIFKKVEAGCRRAFFQSFNKDMLPCLVNHYFRDYKTEKTHLWLIDLATRRGRSNMTQWKSRVLAEMRVCGIRHDN